MPVFSRTFAAIAATMLAWSPACAAAQDAAKVEANAVDESLVAYVDTSDAVTLSDGRRLQFVCMGEGSPTVILSAGLGNWGDTWSTVQPELARTTRVCSWDRPGWGLSDGRPGDVDVETNTRDLLEALGEGGIPGPFVMVGHSLGSYESLLFADRRPADVVGMVLVDPSFPGQMAILDRLAPAASRFQTDLWSQAIDAFRTCAASMRKGEVRFAIDDPSPCFGAAFDPAYPREVTAAIGKHVSPETLESMASFFAGLSSNDARMANPDRDYGDMPLHVLSATKPLGVPDGLPPETVDAIRRGLDMFMPVYAEESLALAALSTRGINARVPDTSHYLHRDKPQVVIDAVEAVIAEARSSVR